MLIFAVTGMAPSNRPDLIFGGVVLFGGTGCLYAALVVAYLTPASVAMRLDRRSKSS